MQAQRLGMYKPQMRRPQLACRVLAEPTTSVVSPPVQQAPFQPVDRKEGLLLQSFGWDSCHHKGGWYNHLKSKVPEMQAAGVTHIWLPPPSQSVSPQGYLPGQLYNLESNYGSKDELVELIRALKAAGISPQADIVINHRCADAQDEHGRWNDYHDLVSHDGHDIDWGRWAITRDDPVFGGTGSKDTGADFHGAPDLDHTNEHLREALCHWLQHLQNEIGFDGWRWDFVKGYAAQYITEYTDASTGAEAFNVGELWTDLHWEGATLGADQSAARQALCDWIDATQRRSCAFDFVTKGVLQEAVRNCEYWRLRDNQGKAPGLLGYWPGRAVTFVDNHDTGSSQQHWPFPSDKIGQGYAYILSHPGIPCLFWEHFFDQGEHMRGEIEALLKVRKQAGIVADSPLTIHVAEHDLYVATVNDRLTIKMGPRFDMPDHLLPREEDGWSMGACGDGYAIWVRGASEDN